MTFSAFKDKVDKSFQQMCKDQTKLFRVEVDKDLIWSTYLNSFPEEERQEQHSSPASTSRQCVLGPEQALGNNTLSQLCSTILQSSN